MELKLINKSEKTIEIEFVGETDTILNLLKQNLLENSKVDLATYVSGHPLLDNPRLYVEVNSGKPETIVKNAAKEVRGAFDEFETQLLRETK